MGAAGMLLAAVTIPAGLMSFAWDPLQGVMLLLVAGAGVGLFVRAWFADRRWRAAQQTTIHRHPAAGRAVARYLPRSGGTTESDGQFGRALRSFLDDPDGLGAVVFDGPGAFRLRFALHPVDRNVLLGRAVAPSRLDPRDRPDQDAWLGLVALGWAAPPPASSHEKGTGIVPREDFAAEWTLPIDIDGFDRFIQSTATIYGIDVTLLQPRFTGGGHGPGVPPSDRVIGVAGPAPFDPYLTLRRWSQHPLARLLTFAVCLGIVAAGRERFGEVFRSIPHVLLFAGLAALFLIGAVHLLNRYLRTADPFSLTGWNWVRGRTVTHYQTHVWWGIFGALSAVVGLFLTIQALTG